MHKASIILSGAAIALLTTMGTASATVTFDSASGTGFVGKGDVQVPWGWNNATLQAQAGSVTFSYAETDSADYDVTCQFDTGTIHVFHHVTNTNAKVIDSVAYDVTKATRQNPKGAVTGFSLIGDILASSDNGAAPAVGDACPGNSALGLVTDVSLPYNQTSDQELSASDTAANKGPTVVWSNGVSVQP